MMRWDAVGGLAVCAVRWDAVGKLAPRTGLVKGRCSSFCARTRLQRVWSFVFPRVFLPYIIAIVLFSSAVFSGGWSLGSPAAAGERVVPPGLACLVRAYPAFLDRAVYDPVRGWMLRWRDGVLMDWDDGRTDKSFTEKLNDPDLEDMMSIPYPVGRDYPTPGADSDPGRIRYQPFFTKMYGGSARAVRSHLKLVSWMPHTTKRRLRATSVNGVDLALAAVSGTDPSCLIPAV